MGLPASLWRTTRCSSRPLARYIAILWWASWSSAGLYLVIMAGSRWETGGSSNWEIKYHIREFCPFWWLCYRAAWLIRVEHATYYTGCMCTKRAVVTCTCPSQGSNGCISLWICDRSFLTILMSFTGFEGNMAVVRYKYSINFRWISTGVWFPM